MLIKKKSTVRIKRCGSAGGRESRDDQERRDEAFLRERGGRKEDRPQGVDRHLNSVCSSNIIIHSGYRDDGEIE